MRFAARTVLVWIGIVASVGACAASRPVQRATGRATSTNTAQIARHDANPGELAPARPSRDARVATLAPASGETGSPTVVRVGARRDALVEFYGRLRRALLRRDLAALQRLFAPSIVALDGSRSLDRTAYLTPLDTLVLAQLDVSRLDAAFGDAPPIVRSHADLGRATDAPPSVMLPGDWLLEFPTRFVEARASVLGRFTNLFPQRFAVRWTRDEPEIIATDASSLAVHR